MVKAIRIISQHKHDPHRAHERIRGFYTWARVAERTEKVYEDVMKVEQISFWDRVDR
jgi:phosphatidylinositol N-acetylglucosaminyltransferase subunit A